jgi:hypothetical protein
MVFLSVVTTPVAYLTSMPDVVFHSRTFRSNGSEAVNRNRFYELTSEDAPGWLAALAAIMTRPPPPAPAPKAAWSLLSFGPDLKYNQGSYLVYGEDYLNKIPAAVYANYGMAGPSSLYDRTNGTMSAGDIVRIGP